MSEQKKPMSLGRAIFTIGMLIFWIIIAAYWSWNLYEDWQISQEDAIYEAHGCYSSIDGTEYICPNGLPPGKEGDKIE